VTVVEEAKANDPKELRKHIADLEAAAKNTTAIDPKAVEEAEKRGFERGKEAVIAEAKCVGQQTIVSALEDLRKLASPLVEALSAGIKTSKTAFPDVSKGVEFKPRLQSAHPGCASRGGTKAATVVLSERQRRPAGPATAHPQFASDLAADGTTGAKQRAGGVARWLQPVIVFIQEPAWRFKRRRLDHLSVGQLSRFMAEAVALAQPIELSGSLLEFVLANLTGPEARILKSIADCYPDATDNSAAAEGARYSATSSSYKNPRARYAAKT
jgi:uncharacterized protein